MRQKGRQLESEVSDSQHWNLELRWCPSRFFFPSSWAQCSPEPRSWCISPLAYSLAHCQHHQLLHQEFSQRQLCLWLWVPLLLAFSFCYCLMIFNKQSYLLLVLRYMLSNSFLEVHKNSNYTLPIQLWQWGTRWFAPESVLVCDIFFVMVQSMVPSLVNQKPNFHKNTAILVWKMACLQCYDWNCYCTFNSQSAFSVLPKFYYISSIFFVMLNFMLFSNFLRSSLSTLSISPIPGLLHQPSQ